jgi:hypothetical protein
MVMPMLMMLLILKLMLDAFEVVAYADVENATADVKMPSIACHLAGTYAIVTIPRLMPFLRQLMLVMMQCRNVCKYYI